MYDIPTCMYEDTNFLNEYLQVIINFRQPWLGIDATCKKITNSLGHEKIVSN